MSRLNVVQVLKSARDGGGGVHMKELIQSAQNTSPYVFLWVIYHQIIAIICGSYVQIISPRICCWKVEAVGNAQTSEWG